MKPQISGTQLDEMRYLSDVFERLVGSQFQEEVRQAILIQGVEWWLRWKLDYVTNVRKLISQAGKKNFPEARKLETAQLYLAAWQTCQEAICVMEPLVDAMIQEPIHGSVPGLIDTLSEVYARIALEEGPGFWPSSWGDGPEPEH